MWYHENEGNFGDLSYIQDVISVCSLRKIKQKRNYVQRKKMCLIWFARLGEKKYHVLAGLEKLL